MSATIDAEALKASLEADFSAFKQDVSGETAHDPEPTPAAEATEEVPDGQSDTPAEDATPEAGTEPAEDEVPKETAPQTKEQKEKARQENTWKKINEEKEALKREREEVQRIREEAEAEKGKKAQEFIESPEPLKDERGFTAADYEGIADKWQENGEGTAEQIKAARAHAGIMRQKEQQAFADAQQQAVNQVVRENPELKDIASPLNIKLREMLDKGSKAKRNPYAHPMGLAQAVQDAKLHLKADSVPALETRVQELTAEIQRLTKLSTPAKGTAVRQQASPKTDTREGLLADMERAMAVG